MRTGCKTVLVTGICTDICVMDFVLTMLSARNHGLMSTLADIVVLEPATATYHLPRRTRDCRRTTWLFISCAHAAPCWLES